MKNDYFRKGLLFGIIILFVGTSVLPAPSSNIRKMESVNSETTVKLQSSDDSMLDMDYIYNLTENLSNIIFTEYNESAGELAKGRAFGTKGEHKAADILYENMTKLGLYTCKEQINNTSKWPELTYKLEILERGMKINNITNNECHIRLRWNLTYMDMLGELKFIYNYPLFCRWLDKKYHLYDKSKLTNNFSYTNLKVIRKPTRYSLIGDLIRLITYNEPFVYIAEDTQFNPNPPEPPSLSLLYKLIFKILNLGKIDGHVTIEVGLWYFLQPNCKGVILYDFNSDTFDMSNRRGIPLPTIYINGTVGTAIDENPENYTIDFYVNQRWNESIESYNVIGQLNGTNPDNKTIIISSLYDSWWCQGTGDSAIGMATVLGIAKYFHDHNITPKYNLKFIAFGGEEYGMVGAYHYEETHRKESIPFIIDLNQIGFKQLDPRLTLFIRTNNESFNSTLRKIGDETNYVYRTGNVADFLTWAGSGWVSNDRAFGKANREGNRSCSTICFVKDTGWKLHHRDGLNHTDGDSMKYYDKNDVSITSEMIWNITKYFAVDPDCWFENESFSAIDSPDDGDDLNDSIKATFTIKTTLPSDRVMVNASLIKKGSEEVVVNKIVNYTVTSEGIQDTITLTVPEDGEEGWYTCTFLLYNSTGRINEILHLDGNNVNDTIPRPPEVICYYLYPYGAEND